LADLKVKDADANLQTIFDYTCFTTKHCPGHVNVKSDGTEIFTTGAPGVVNVNNIPHVICDSGCSGSGGTSSTFGAAFPSLGTAIGISAGGNMTAWTAKAGNTYVNTDVVPGVAVVNATTPGQAAMSASSPVAIASDQSAVSVKGALQIAGGWTKKRLSGLSTTVVPIKSSAAGQLGLLHCNSPNSAIEYVQLFDVATAGGVTLGTTVPDLSFAVPATNATGFTLPLTGYQFTNGIQIAATTTATGLTAPATALDCNAGYN
jgi:hypothetical protein